MSAFKRLTVTHGVSAKYTLYCKAGDIMSKNVPILFIEQPCLINMVQCCPTILIRR